MKPPRYVLRVGHCDYLISTKDGVGKLTEILADAMPVNAHLHREQPEIELAYDDEPQTVRYLQRVDCERIPANVIYKRKTKSGEVEIVRPVTKAPKALRAPKQKALPAPNRPALPPSPPQLFLL